MAESRIPRPAPSSGARASSLLASSVAASALSSSAVLQPRDGNVQHAGPGGNPNKRKADAPGPGIQRTVSLKRSSANVAFTPASLADEKKSKGKDENATVDGMTFEELAADGWTHDALIEHKLQGFKKFDHKGKFDAALAHIRRMRVGYKHSLAEEANARADAAAANAKGAAELAEKQKEYDELDGRLAASHNQCAALKEDKAGLQSSIVALEVDKASLEENVAELTAARDEARGEAAELTKDLARANDDGAKLKTEVEKLGEQVEQAQAYGQSLQESNAKLMKDNAESAAQIQGMLSEKAKLAEELGGLKGSYAAVSMQLESATTKTIPELEAAKASLSSDLAAANASNADLSSAKAALTTEVAGLKSSLDDASDKARRLGAEVDELGSAKMRLEGELGSACAARDEASAALASLRAEHATTSDELRTASETLATTRAELEGTAATLKASQEEAEARLAECTTLQRQVGSVSDELNATSASLTALTAEHATACSQRDVATAGLAKTEAELASVRQQMSLVERERAGLEERSKSLDTQLAAKSAECTELASRLKIEEAETANLRAATAEYERIAATSQTDNSSLQARAMALAKNLAEAERRVAEGELLRRKMHNTIMELKGNVRVFCRARPLNDEERAAAEASESLQMQDGSDELALTTAGAGARGSREERHLFQFDKVFAPTTSQATIFEEISQLVQSALDGYRVCIFAYGQTGSGKTYTMVGGDGAEHQGIIPRSLVQIFQHAKQLEAEMGWKFEMEAQLLEIYNEEVRDLLTAPSAGKADFSMSRSESAAGPSLTVKHDSQGNTTVGDAKLVPVSDPKEVQSLLDRANARRSTASTNMNERSSRSHCVFRLLIKGQQEVEGGAPRSINGVLNLVDLAGSERLAKTQAKGDRLKEAQHINKSLSALGDVISSIASNKGKKADAHVPYRNSKLTYLLQPCLSGDAKTLMFVNVSPSSESSHETLCSLRFASKVNQCETR